MEKPQYYSITVKKMNILTRHSDWLVKTQELYNQILEFYYNLYLDTFQDGRPGSMEALRTLEKLTIPGRDRQPVQYPLPWQKVPLYFRRAAINSAIAAASSYLSREKQKIRSTSFTESVTCYKGMYRDFEGNAITLKVWTGEKWLWNRIKLRGNTIPEEGQMMSPSIVLKKTGPELHIPWKTFVKDGRTAKERMAAGEKICAVTFTNQDALAVCCVLNSDGTKENAFFVRGGAEYSVALSYLSKINKKTNSLFKWTYIVGIVVCGIGYIMTIILSRPVLSILYPKYVDAAMQYIWITSGTIVVSVLTSMITPFVLRFFDIKWQIWINGITTIMYIIISLSLLKLGGLMGFCIGALLANIIKLLITTYVYLKKTSRSSE